MAISRFAFWNPGTWQIPKLYWDAFSDEQRIHAICKQLGKVIAYADYLGINVEDIADRLKAIEEGELDPYIFAKIEEWFEEHHPQIEEALAALNEALPIEDFDAENTVKDALDAINDRFPVETADIADGAVTSAKIADGAIMDIVGMDFDRLQFLAAKDFQISNRFLLGTSINTQPPFYGRGASQGSCVFRANDRDYWLCATNPDNDNKVIIVDMATNEVVFSGAFPLGHANGCSYDGDHTVVFANNINKTLVYLDVSNPTTPIIDDTVYTPGAETYICACFIGTTGKVALIHGQLVAYNFNVTGATIYSDYTLTEELETVSFDLDSSFFAGWQSVTCDGNYFYLAFSFPETIIILDMEGNNVANINMPFNIEHIQVNEIESAFIYDGKLWVSIFEWLEMTIYPDDPNANTMHASSLVYVDLEHSNPVRNRTYHDLQTVFELDDPFYLFTNDLTAFNRKLLNPNRYGWLFIDDMFVNQRTLNFEHLMHINLVRDYSLPIRIWNTTVLLNLNGHNIYSIYQWFSQLQIIGTGEVYGNWPRTDSIKFGIVCSSSRLTIPSTVTFAAGLSNDINADGSIIQGAKPQNTMNIRKVNGTIVGNPAT